LKKKKNEEAGKKVNASHNWSEEGFKASTGSLLNLCV
jgi:hypothetical protein